MTNDNTTLRKEILAEIKKIDKFIETLEEKREFLYEKIDKLDEE